ncbi:MAG: hypothetical protein JWM42_1001, partial [Burkholderia sp.]|nr:hypothetical protein [Burkholderia sp.]
MLQIAALRTLHLGFCPGRPNFRQVDSTMIYKARLFPHRTLRIGASNDFAANVNLQLSFTLRFYSLRSCWSISSNTTTSFAVST